MIEEKLSFTLRPAESHADLLRACSVRAQAYGRKNPAYRETMAVPDEIDASPWTAVFLCEDKLTGEAIGTTRVQSTTRGDATLEIEKYVEPPAEILRFGRAEISRLSAVHGADPFVRLALWKAAYLYCLAIQVRWLVIGVRKPALLRAYERMGARDVFEDQRLVTLGHGGNLPYRILALDISSCEQRFREEGNPLYGFMFGTVHRDISVVPSVNRDVAEEVRLHVVERAGEVVERVGAHPLLGGQAQGVPDFANQLLDAERLR
jgi:hypothetical protein